MKNKSIIFGAAFIAFFMLLSVTAVPQVNSQPLVEQSEIIEISKSEQTSLYSAISDVLLSSSNGDIPDIEEKIVWKIGDFLIDDYFNDSNGDRRYVQNFRVNNVAFNTLCNQIENKFKELENDQELNEEREEFLTEDNKDEMPGDQHKIFAYKVVQKVRPAIREVFDGENFNNLLNDEEFEGLVDDLALGLEEKGIHETDTSGYTNDFWDNNREYFLTELCSTIFFVNFLLFGESTITFGLTTMLCVLLILLPSIKLCYDTSPFIAAIEGFLAVMVLVFRGWLEVFKTLAKFGLFGIFCAMLSFLAFSPAWLTASVLVGLIVGFYSAISQYDINEHFGIMKEIIEEAADYAYEWWQDIWPWQDKDKPKSYTILSVRLMELVDRLLKRFLSSFLSKYPSINV